MNKFGNIVTDLAIEAAVLNGADKADIDGAQIDTWQNNGIEINKVVIKTEGAAQKIGKPIGTYITLDAGILRKNDEKSYEITVEILTRQLESILKLHKKSSVLVVGLGNRYVTPDALGPKVVDNLMVTRHLLEELPEVLDDDVRAVSAVTPGVLGLTGIETWEIIKGITDKVKPDAVIAIDALASRKIDRISTTIQLADTGIVPGSGIGNKRIGITEETLGIPVVAIGVPTVVDAATVANDTIELLNDAINKYADKNSPLKKQMEFLNSTNRYALIKEVLYPFVGELIVTPKEVDSIIDDISEIIARSINMALLGQEVFNF